MFTAITEYVNSKNISFELKSTMCPKGCPLSCAVKPYAVKLLLLCTNILKFEVIIFELSGLRPNVV